MSFDLFNKTVLTLKSSFYLLRCRLLLWCLSLQFSASKYFVEATAGFVKLVVNLKILSEKKAKSDITSVFFDCLISSLCHIMKTSEFSFS